MLPENASCATSIILSHFNKARWISAFADSGYVKSILFSKRTNKSRPSMNNGCQCVLIENKLATERRADGTDTGL